MSKEILSFWMRQAQEHQAKLAELHLAILDQPSPVDNTAEIEALRREVETLKAENLALKERAAPPPAQPKPSNLKAPPDGFKRDCKRCGQHFATQSPRQLYCSKACAPSGSERAKMARERKAKEQTKEPAPEPEPSSPPQSPPTLEVPKQHAWGEDTFAIRRVVACVECRHGKPQPASETGWECTAERARSCWPMGLARHLEPRQQVA